MRNLNLDQLQTLIAIADLGTLAAAAQALHLAPPTVSLHIKELESRLGAALLVRGRRQTSLTPAGMALVQGGRRLLANADEVVEQVRRQADGRGRLVRLGTSAGVSADLLPRFLKLLAQRSPGVDIQLQIVSSADAMARLRTGTLDVAIVALPPSASAEVRVDAWRNDPMVAFLPPHWQAPEQVTPAWLAERPWICFGPTTQMYRLIAAWLGQAGLNPRPRIEIDHPQAIHSLVCAGHGAALLPLEPPHGSTPVDNSQMRPLSPPLVRPLGLAHRASASSDAAITAVLEALQTFSGTQPA